MNQAIPKKAAAVMDCGSVGIPSVGDTSGNASSMPLAVKVSDIAHVGQLLTVCDLSAQDLLSFGACSKSKESWSRFPELPPLVLSFAAIARGVELIFNVRCDVRVVHRMNGDIEGTVKVSKTA
jgi:hypothetical protein